MKEVLYHANGTQTEVEHPDPEPAPAHPLIAKLDDLQAQIEVIKAGLAAVSGAAAVAMDAKQSDLADAAKI